MRADASRASHDSMRAAASRTYNGDMPGDSMRAAASRTYNSNMPGSRAAFSVVIPMCRQISNQPERGNGHSSSKFPFIISASSVSSVAMTTNQFSVLYALFFVLRFLVLPAGVIFKLDLSIRSKYYWRRRIARNTTMSACKRCIGEGRLPAMRLF